MAYNSFSPRRALLTEKGLSIYSDRQDIEATRIIKTLTQRRMRSEPRPHWEAPISLENVMVLERNGFLLEKSIKEWMDNLFWRPPLRPNFQVPDLNGELLPYQLEGIQIIDALDGRALLADDPGLGKSIQAIAWCHWRRQRKILIVGPAFSKHNWANEITWWTGETRVQVLTGDSWVRPDSRYVVMNYDILVDSRTKDIRDDIWDIPWDVIILDECHYISNPEALRTLAAKALAENVPHLITISATPGKNRPADLFTAINLVSPAIFPSFTKYGHRYCGAKKVRDKWEFKGSTNEKELFDLLTKSIMIRRKKEDVFKDLPRKIRIPVLLGDTSKTKWKASDASDFNSFEKLKQAAVIEKLPAAIEWIRNMLCSEDKLIIFAEHKITIDALMEAFEGIAVKVDGSVSDAGRKEAVDKFQRCARCGVKKEFHDRDSSACFEYKPDLSTRLFIGSRAAKESGTLTAAEHVVFLELWWSMSDHLQAEDRAYGRAGDLHGATCWYLISPGSVEETIADILSLKDRRVTRMIDGMEVSPEMVLSELIRRKRNAAHEPA